MNSNEPFSQETRENKSQPIFNLPPFVKLIAIFLISIHILLPFLPEPLYENALITFSFIPARYINLDYFYADLSASLLGPISHSFIHNDWIHLLSNTGMFIAFAPNFIVLTSNRFLIIVWLLGAIGGAFTTAAIAQNPNIILIGASGAISALLGGVLYLSWQATKLGYAASLPFATKKRILTFLSIWLAINLSLALFPANHTMPGIAWEAHIAGLLIGILCSAVYFQVIIKRHKIK